MSNRENEKSAQQGSCCGKLKFSMVRDMLVKREIEMDEPGVLTVVDMEGVHTQMVFDSLPVLSRKRSVLSMLNGAFAQLAKDGMGITRRLLLCWVNGGGAQSRILKRASFLRG